MTTAKVNNYPTTPLGLKEPKNIKSRGERGKKKKIPNKNPNPLYSITMSKRKSIFLLKNSLNTGCKKSINSCSDHDLFQHVNSVYIDINQA